MTNRPRLAPWHWALLLVSLSTPFWSLSHPLIEVDDARYAEVPREMVQSGDWATPHLDGFDYVEKPPLWYWTCALSYEAFGVSEAAARAAMGIFSLAALLATLWLGWWLFSPETGVWAAALLSSAGLFFFLEHYLTPDLPLTACLLLCMAFALRALERPEDAGWAAPLAWTAAGLAFLAKGLVGLVFPVGWLMAGAILFPRYRRPAAAFLRPLGPVLFLAVAAPWYLVMERRHPGFLRFMFVEQHFQRFLTSKYNRASPWYFFLLVLPAGLLPWTPAFLDALAKPLRSWNEDPRAAALAGWIVMITIFFSSSHSKLATYILPVAPQAAVLGALVLHEPRPWARKLALSLAALFAAALVVLLVGARLGRLPPLKDGPPWADVAGFGAAALAFLSAGLAGWGLGKGRAALVISGWLVGATALWAIRANAAWLSVKDLGRRVAQLAGPDDEIWVYGIYLHGLPFYARRRVDRVIDWTGELHYAKRDPANAARFGEADALKTLPLRGRHVVLVARAQDAREILTLVNGEKVVDNERFGRWIVLKL